MAESEAGDRGVAEAGDSPPSSDVVVVHGPTAHGVAITRVKNEQVELGELRPIREGQSIHGEVVKLRPRKESERVFDVEVLHAGAARPEPAPLGDTGHKGPPKVASERYRVNYDVVFGSKKSSALN